MSKHLGQKRDPGYQPYFTEFNYEEQYYCKDLALFIIKEPCIMCTMALSKQIILNLNYYLVHSRIAEVYYIEDNLVDGGMGKVINLNDYDNLNHDFLIYKYTI